VSRSPGNHRGCDAADTLRRAWIGTAARLDVADPIADRRPGAQPQFRRGSPLRQPAMPHQGQRRDAPVVGDKPYGVDETLFLSFCRYALTSEDHRRLRLLHQEIQAVFSV
jgi:hypothetical protein